MIRLMSSTIKDPIKMLAASLKSPGNLVLEERDIPVPGPGEILLRIEATTLCGTDGRVFTGEKTALVRAGVVPGHEFAGRIAAIGEGVQGYQVGKQATVSIVVSCGHCPECLDDREHLCENLELFGYGIDGGLQEYCLVPAKAVSRGNVIQVEKELSARALALAEPVSCCLHGLNQYTVNLGDTVVIMGAGPIGLIHTQLAKAAGAKHIVVSNRSSQRRDIALAVGATHVVDPQSESLTEVVHGLTGGRGADAVVVCIGAADLANQALELARNGGRVNFFAGFPKGSSSAMEPNIIHYKELTVTGGSNAYRRDVVQAIRVLEEGIIDVDAIVTHSFPLTEVHQAYEAMMNRTGLKIVVVPQK